ncbi:MAG: PHP domain-containing protein [Balneolaceae bacterium]
MNSWTSLHNHSFYSVLDGFASPDEMAKRASDLGMSALAITDHGSVSGVARFFEACKEFGIKPIAGSELYISHDHATIKDKAHKLLSHMVVLAKNIDGWHDLIELIEASSSEKFFYYKPRIHFFGNDGLEKFAQRGNLIGLNGHQGSILSNSLFVDLSLPQEEIRETLREAYRSNKNTKTTEHFKQFLIPNWLEQTSCFALRLEKIFGKGNFFIEIQNELNENDSLALYIHPLIRDCLREVSLKTGIPVCPTCDSHYADKNDAEGQRTLILIQQKLTEQEAEDKIEREDDDLIGSFLGSENFYIHSNGEMLSSGFTQEELKNSIKIADMCDIYDLTSDPLLPSFDVPDFPKDNKILSKYKSDADKYLMHLCIIGAQELQPWIKTGKTKREYWDQIKYEISVIENAKLSDYFLIVRDLCMAADNRPSDHSFDWQKWRGEIDPIKRGPGRGSAAGCLISYLIGITKVDPLMHGLWFSRFYNSGRNKPGHISLPDIDCDFAVTDRDWVINYLRHKYGEDHVGYMVTFGRIMGKAAVKDVFRIKGIKNGYTIVNELSKYIPDESQISDELNEIRKSDPDYGILRWAVDNSDTVAESYNSHLRPLFDLAMRLEGVKRNQGRHASGIIVSKEPLSKFLPVVFDPKTKSRIVGFEMNDTEKCGGVKFDILGVTVLDKIKFTEDLINGRKTEIVNINKHQK